MRLSHTPAEAAMLSAIIFPLLSAANKIDCHNVQVKGVGFDLHELGGARSVMNSVKINDLKLHNTTYTVDICAPLRRTKDAPKGEQCPSGTRVCGIERLVSVDGATDEFETAIPIAGELLGQGGTAMEAKWELLSKSSSHEDSQKEGLLLTMNGGFVVEEDKNKKKQKAIIEFVCDKSRTGLENLYDPEDKYDDNVDESEKREEKEDSPTDDNSELPADASSLIFFKYDKSSSDEDILRLKWHTKFACESSKEEQDAEKGSHWGFFTWFILIAFLSTATYLIFGSWLNYNRYGARGWDLLPHGDTIRDVPYLLKDWIRRVVSTIQGGGSRGGYAAV